MAKKPVTKKPAKTAVEKTSSKKTTKAMVAKVAVKKTIKASAAKVEEKTSKASAKKVVAKDLSHLKRLITAEIKKNGPNCDLNFIDVSKVTSMESHKYGDTVLG